MASLNNAADWGLSPTDLCFQIQFAPTLIFLVGFQQEEVNLFISVSVILCRTHVIFTIRWLLAKLLSALWVLIEGAALFAFKIQVSNTGILTA